VALGNLVSAALRQDWEIEKQKFHNFPISKFQNALSSIRSIPYPVFC